MRWNKGNRSAFVIVLDAAGATVVSVIIPPLKFDHGRCETSLSVVRVFGDSIAEREASCRRRGFLTTDGSIMLCEARSSVLPPLRSVGLGAI
jgi:hypothetical protein